MAKREAKNRLKISPKPWKALRQVNQHTRTKRCKSTIKVQALTRLGHAPALAAAREQSLAAAPMNHHGHFKTGQMPSPSHEGSPHTSLVVAFLMSFCYY